MNLTIKYRCLYATIDEWNTPGSIPKGIIADGVLVEYAGHLPGGMVQVIHNGQNIVIHPGATKELTSRKSPNAN